MDRKVRLKSYSSKLVLTLRVIDVLLVASIFFGVLELHGVHVGERLTLLGIVAGLLTALSLEAVGLYRRWRGAHLRREVHTVLAGWGLVAAGVFVAGLLGKALESVPAHVLSVWLVLSPAAIAGAHALGRVVLRVGRSRGYNHRTAVIVGAGAVGMALARKIQALPWAGIDLVGFFDDDPGKVGRTIEGLPVRGTVDDLAEFVGQEGVDMVYLTLPMRAEARMLQVMEAVNTHPVAVYMVPDVFAFDLLGSKLIDLDGIPVVSLSESPQIGPAGAVKRLEDLILAGLGLLVFSPLLLVVALLIKRASPGPAIFSHARIGRHGRTFRCFKFRTMVVDAESALRELFERDPEARREWEENHKLKSDPRITPIGRFLRRTSLDELPQLWNVIRGEMSLVGPRPIVEAEIPKYGRYYRHLIMVRPGMTGLWQISGRNDVTYQARVEMDVHYARGWSVWQDLSILWKTIGVVVARSGSY